MKGDIERSHWPLPFYNQFQYGTGAYLVTELCFCLWSVCFCVGGVVSNSYICVYDFIRIKAILFKYSTSFVFWTFTDLGAMGFQNWIESQKVGYRSQVFSKVQYWYPIGLGPFYRTIGYSTSLTLFDHYGSYDKNNTKYLKLGH